MASRNGHFDRGAMPCDSCGGDTVVYWTGLLDKNIYRKRRCLVCGYKVETRETISRSPLHRPEDCCKNGHKRTPFNTYTRPNGTKECRLCLRDKAKERREAVEV